MNEEVRFCTTEDCRRLTHMYLCTACILELDELLQDVPSILERIDDVIYRLEQTRAPGAGGGGGVAGSKPAMNVDAYILKAHLHSLPCSANAEAAKPTASQTLYMAHIWIPQGRDLVWGPEDKRVYGQCGLIDEPDPDIDDDEPLPCPGHLIAHPDETVVKCPECKATHMVAEILDELRQKVRGQPSTPSQVRAHLQRRARVTVTKFDIENWVKRGKLGYVLDRVGIGRREQRLYYPGDVLSVAEETRARRRL